MDDTESTVKVLIQVVDRVRRISPTSLGEALTGVAPHEEIRIRKRLKLGNVAGFYNRSEVVLVRLAGELRDVICPDNLVAQIRQRQI
jgi:hypothetical protein